MRIMLCASPWWSQRTETAKSAQWGLPILKLLRTWAAQEEPGKIIDTGKNVLEYYPRAMKLSVAKPSWTNAMGEVKRGKTVVLDLSAVKNNPEAAAMFRRIAERMEG